MKKNEATARPWSARPNPDKDGRHSHWIDGAVGEPVCETRDLGGGAGEANARLIVRSVNNAERLADVLREEQAALKVWQSVKLPADVREGVEISLSKIQIALAAWERDE